MSNGVMVCPVCFASIIEEEMGSHKHSKTWKIVGDILYVRRRDGKWYSHELVPDEALPPTNRTPSDDQPDSEHYQNHGNNQFFSNLLITFTGKS